MKYEISSTNNLKDEISKEISCLNQLELFLICKRFLFEKMLIMPKGQETKLHGAIVSVSVDTNKV